MKDKSLNAFIIIKNIIKAILLICSVIAMIAGIFDQLSQKRDWEDAEFEDRKPHKMKGAYERFLKRPLDAFLSTGALIVLSPVLLATAIAVRLKLGSPVFFTQDRPGKNGKIFKLFKFRTMTDEKDENGELLSDEERLTSFVQNLRSTSLDGNVIIGQTTESLVNKGFREVSLIHFSKGRDLFSQYYNDFHAGGEGVLVA